MINLKIGVAAKIDPEAWALAYGFAPTALAMIDADVRRYLGQVDEIVAGLNEQGGFGSNVTVTGFAIAELQLNVMLLDLDVTAQVDPEVWALEYSLDAQNLASIEADVLSYLGQAEAIVEHLNGRHCFGPNVEIIRVRPAQVIR